MTIPAAGVAGGPHRLNQRDSPGCSENLAGRLRCPNMRPSFPVYGYPDEKDFNSIINAIKLPGRKHIAVDDHRIRACP